jgi:superfamily II DNA or RNA helicase
VNTLFPIGVSSAPKAPALKLRPYQTDGVAAILARLEESSSCLAVMATGVGKTEVAAALIKQIGQDGSLFITPLIELVTQTAARLRSRGIPCGIEQASSRSADPVTVACYASLLSRKRYEGFLGGTKLVIVDESHLNYTKRGLQMLDHLRQSGARIVGLTASPDRATGDPLTEWYGPCAFHYGYEQALRDGWLVPAKLWLTVLEEMDLSGFSRAGSDFEPEKLARIMAREQNVQAIASMVEQHHEGQPSVVFCQSIQQSEMLREVLTRRGITSAIVHSQMDAAERRIHLQDFEERNTDLVLNVGCLTLGWDWPPVRKLFIAKPTRSKARYIQMFGRGTRPLPGVVDGWATSAQRRTAIADSDKPFFEVFDITDTSRHNDLRTALDVVRPDLDANLLRRVRKKGEGKGLEPRELDAAVEAEKAALASEQAALDALEADRRHRLLMEARFGVYGRDPHALAESRVRKVRRWHMLFGKHKGQPLSRVPLNYLRWVLSESNCRNMAFMDAVAREVKSRT